MTIAEGIRAISDEYDEESVRARNDPAFHRLMTECMGQEYNEIDEELPNYVAQIASAHGAPTGTILPAWVYQMARMCFRLGMRTQRKLDDPEEPTSSFWRSDGRPI